MKVVVAVVIAGFCLSVAGCAPTMPDPVAGKNETWNFEYDQCVSNANVWNLTGEITGSYSGTAECRRKANAAQAAEAAKKSQRLWAFMTFSKELLGIPYDAAAECHISDAEDAHKCAVRYWRAEAEDPWDASASTNLACQWEPGIPFDMEYQTLQMRGCFN